MKYTIELTDTEYNVLTGFMDMISTEIKAEYFQKAKLEPTEKAWEDKLAEAKEFAYKKGYEDGAKNQDEVQYKKGYDAGRKDGFAYCRDNTELTNELKQEEYNKALKDVNHAIDVLKGMTVTECEEWFEDCDEIGDVVCKFTIQGIIRRTKAYGERKEDEIRVGDEVKTEGGCKATVTYIYDRKVADLMFRDGSTGKRKIESLNKTGRNFGNEVEQVINKLRGKE